MAKVFFISILSPLAVFAFHIVSIRVFGLERKLAGQSIVGLSALAGYLPVALALVSTGVLKEEGWWAAIYVFISYSALAYSYFHIYNMSETARRIRILRELYPDRVMSALELESGYNAIGMLENRLERLVSTGQADERGDRYVLKGRLIRYAAKAVAWWAGVLGLPFKKF